MAVFRVERTRDYTVMSNYHLKDTGLTLKAKGLLSMMLSLPDEWNYTTRGLASICKESVETIGKTLRELNIRAKLGVNIIAVESGKKTNVAPSADYQIQPGDVMVVLGDNYSLEAVQKL